MADNIASSAPAATNVATGTIFGFPADVVTAAGTLGLAMATVVLALPTIFLAIAAWKQLPLLRDQLASLVAQLDATQQADRAESDRQHISREEANWRQIEAQTLQACERYFTNSVVYAATRAVYAASKNGQIYDKDAMKHVEHDLLTVLNYLNALAVGVDEGIYSGDIIKDHLPNTIMKVVDVLIPKLVDQPAKWQPLLNLRDNWKTSNPSYRRPPHGVLPERTGGPHPMNRPVAKRA